MTDFKTTRNLVKNILKVCSEGKNELSTQWSFQGLGMYRLYLDDAHTQRLHVWKPSERIYVNEIHTHPWDFTSLVINGRVVDHIYKEDNSPYSLIHNKQKLFCGIGGGLEESPTQVPLTISKLRVVDTGNGYDADRTVIHKSQPFEGTVTLITRSVPEGMSKDHAFVYWPIEQEWGNAEPRLRLANWWEVNAACVEALRIWE